MCGIAGILALDDRVDETLIREMAERMTHRGPDGEGFYFAEGVGLGVRRLAIIDPERGHQPLYNEDRAIVCVFNGEIYNHAELRQWLEARGHRLDSGSDGAILPHLYEELGDSYVDRLNGIFAIAMWDSRRRTLQLSRDRFGVKPLYWSRTGRRITFASELKALLCDERVSRDIDKVAVDHFLTFRFVPSPRTMFRAVKKLSPATILTIGLAGVSERRYWDGEPTGDRRDRERLVEEYQDAFERAVVGQMMSDRPIGVMLSGGVDSGAITAVMAANSSQVRTFTMGFAEGGDTNEIALARQTASLFGTDHHSVTVSASEYRANLPDSLLKVEEPVGTTSALAVNYVTRLMRPHVPVALSGQGADEPLAGYQRHLGLKLAGWLQPFASALRIAARTPPVRRNARVQRGVATLARREPLDRLMAAYSVFTDADKKRLYSREFVAELNGDAPEWAVEQLRRRVDRLDPLAQMLYVDTRLWLPDELLLIADKMSMAASVEVRVPFLDQDLIALVESMHSSQKLRGVSRKSLHKEAMLKWLPRRVVYRKERGWATPMDRWLRDELRPLLTDVVLNPHGLCAQLFRQAELRRMIDVHTRGNADLTRQLFCLLSLGLWHRRFAGTL